MTGQEWLQYFMADQQKKRKNDWLDSAGTLAGAGIGALLAVPTGGLSIPAGAMLGSQIGGAAGNLAENASNKTLTPQNVISDAAKAYGGLQGTQTPKASVTPRQAVPNPPMPDPFSPDQGFLGPNADLLRFLQGGGTFPMRFAQGGMVPDLNLLAELGIGPDSGTWDAPRPTPQPMAQAKHPGWEAAAAILGDVLSKLPPPRQTNSSNKTVGAYMPALGAGLSGIAGRAAEGREMENRRRTAQNIAAEESWRTGAREMSRRRWELQREAMKPQAADVPGAEDVPVTPEEAKRMGHPEWAGMTRRDIRLQQQGKDAKSGEVTPSTKASFINTLVDNMRSDPDVKDFNVVATNYRRVAKMAEMGNGVGDMAIIFSYMKVLDPTSVVRESEFKNAAEAIGRIEMLRNAPAWVLEGNKLTPKGRQWFLDASRALFDAKRVDFANALSAYEEQGKEYGVRPELVTGRYRKYLDDGFMGIKREPKAEVAPSAPRAFPQAGRRVQ